MEKKVLGIIGGMGPAATVDMMDKIVRFTDAKSDREHVRVLIDVNTKIPDRSASIKGDGENCVAAIVDSAKRLCGAGADYLLLACNTSHYYLDEIQKAVPIPFISMVEALKEYARDNGIGRVALLASDGTMNGRVYDRILEPAGIGIVHPSKEQQAVAMKAIYDVKSFGAESVDVGALNEVIRSYKEQGAEAIVLACTEFPLLLSKMDKSLPFLDATEIVIRKAIRMAGYSLK